MHAHGDNRLVGSVDHERNGFDPVSDRHRLRLWRRQGRPRRPDGPRVDRHRRSTRRSRSRPGVFFPAWTYNGRVPGPDAPLRSRASASASSSRTAARTRTSMHFHGIHSARMDGVPGAGVIEPGEEFIYEFDARPFGCHLYHCHALPLKRHIHKGMYGAFIVDPDPRRHPDERAAALSRRHGTPENAGWQEFVMVMNAFDTNFDDENEFYAVNTIPLRLSRAADPHRAVAAGAHLSRQHHRVRSDQLVPPPRQLLRLLRPRHDADADARAPSTRSCSARRSAASSSSPSPSYEPGLYMFHAHQSEFAELGWMSHFEVV